MPVMYCVFAAPHQSTEAGGRQAYSRREILLTILAFVYCIVYMNWKFFILNVFYELWDVQTIMACTDDHLQHVCF